MSRRWEVLVVGSLAAMMAAGCGGDEAGNGGGATLRSLPATTELPLSPIACELLAPAELGEVGGVEVKATPATDGDRPACSFERVSGDQVGEAVARMIVLGAADEAEPALEAAVEELRGDTGPGKSFDFVREVQLGSSSVVVAGEVETGGIEADDEATATAASPEASAAQLRAEKWQRVAFVDGETAVLLELTDPDFQKPTIVDHVVRRVGDDDLDPAPTDGAEILFDASIQLDTDFTIAGALVLTDPSPAYAGCADFASRRRTLRVPMPGTFLPVEPGPLADWEQVDVRIEVPGFDGPGSYELPEDVRAVVLVEGGPAGERGHWDSVYGGTGSVTIAADGSGTVALDGLPLVPLFGQQHPPLAVGATWVCND